MAVYTTVNDAAAFVNPLEYTGTVRGVTEALYPNINNAETTDAQSVTAFGSDGFSVGTSTTWNTSGAMMCWNWKAGTTTGIDATGVTITPTAYSFNQTAGCSIITYTGNGVAGATVPHGLGVVPGFIIVKCTSTTGSWAVFQGSSIMTATKFMYLDENQAAQSETARWNDTAPTSVLFSLGTSSSGNTNTATYVAYCFAPVQGYSKYGEYEGTGNADGTFIFTGFRPALIITKRVDSTSNWFLWDNKRNGYNPANDYFLIDTTGAESPATNIDILSNGFKFKSSDVAFNASAGDYIYMAWAESPFVNDSGVPSNAR